MGGSYTSLGGRLAEERARLGLTQRDVAAACNTTREAVGRYERDVNVPGGDAFKAFARLGMDVQYVLTGVRSANLLQVAEEYAAYPPARVAPLQRAGKREVDPVVLAGVIAGVEEYLAERRQKMPADKKTELIMLLCDFLTAEAAGDVGTVKTAVAKIIQLRGRGA